MPALMTGYPYFPPSLGHSHFRITGRAFFYTVIQHVQNTLTIKPCDYLIIDNKGGHPLRPQLIEFSSGYLVCVHIPNFMQQTILGKKLFRCTTVRSGLR